MILYLDRNVPVTFTYTNYKNETGKRTVRPHCIYWGKTQYHPESQWLMDAWDEDKKALRTFAMKDMKGLNINNGDD